MKPIDQPAGLCSMDPVSLIGAGLGTLAGAIFGGGGQQGAAPAPADPPKMQAPQSSPTGGKKTNAAPQPTFVGSAPTGPSQVPGGKTLLGQ